MRNTVVVLLLCLSALVLGLFLGTRAGHFLEPNEMVRDTVVVRDTIRVPEPYPVKEYVVRVDTLLWTDTLRFDDTVFVEIPISQKVYEDSLYRAWVSGYKASLDSIYVFPRHTVETVYVPGKDRRRWGIGLQIGIGTDLKGWSPYVGIGVSYDLLRW